MKYFLDLSLLLLIVLTVVLCWKRGFVRSVFGTAKNLLAIILTYAFGSVASGLISQYLLTEKVTEYVRSRLLAMFEAGAETFDLSRVADNLPSWVGTILEKTGMDPTSLIGSLGDATSADMAMLDSLATKLAAPIIKTLSDFLGYTIVFLVSLLVLTIVAALLKKLVELPIIRDVDHILGLVLGILLAILYASAYTLLAFAVLSMIEGVRPDFAFHEAYEQTILFQRVYGINLFRLIFGIG